MDLDSITRYDVEQADSAAPGDAASPDEAVIPPWKKNLVVWKIVGAVVAVLVTLGWVGIIAVLILREEWQLVLVAWLLLYAAAHFCYWYCRRHSVLTLHTQLRQRLAQRHGSTEAALHYSAPRGDRPPSYEDLVKDEAPPPAYYTVVCESPAALTRRALTRLHHPFAPLARLIKWRGDAEAPAAGATEVATQGHDKPDVTVVTLEADPAAAAAAAGAAEAGSAGGAWKSSSSSGGGVALDGAEEEEEAAFSLPSYDTLMREAAQPVMSPIHQALARLPSLPPPYSPPAAAPQTQQQPQHHAGDAAKPAAPAQDAQSNE